MPARPSARGTLKHGKGLASEQGTGTVSGLSAVCSGGKGLSSCGGWEELASSYSGSSNLFLDCTTLKTLRTAEHRSPNNTASYTALLKTLESRPGDARTSH